mgnify:FL=1
MEPLFRNHSKGKDEVRKHIPLCLNTRPFSAAFREVLDFHLSDGAKILDPTPGKGYSWQQYRQDCEENAYILFPRKQYSIHQDESFFTTSTPLQSKYDAVYFDPPYFFGLGQTSDPREKDYGNYNHEKENLCKLLIVANIRFPQVLQKTGKLFFKYSDFFSVKDRCFHFCIPLWIPILNNFKVVDHYIIPHHRLTPTAWQVKNRPCGIVNYTYLSVLEVRNGQ